MGWVKRIAIGAGVTVVGLGVVVAGTIESIRFDPDPEMPAELHCSAEAPEVPTDAELTVLVWNVQFAGSRRHHFFYDGGEAVSVSEDDVRSTLDGLVKTVRELDPDIILWQEVDRDSRRTHHIDQVAALAEALAYPCWSSAPYFKAGYVPHPGNEFLGKMDMHLSTFSKYRIASSTRVQLPLLDEPWWRQMFNLKRAILVDTLPIAGGGSLTLLNTHLSAFSNGDGTLGRQVEVVQQQLAAAGERWILGGDFNSLPPGDDPSRLEGGELYAEDKTPVQPLFDAHRVAMTAATPDVYTYQPFQGEPDRTIDYIFYSDALYNRGFRVERSELSDHLPLVFDVSLTEPEPEPEEPVEPVESE